MKRISVITFTYSFPIFFLIFPLLNILGLTALSALSLVIFTPIFSLIKTIIDCNTRKFTPQNEIPEIIQAISNANAKQITELSEQVINYKGAQSIPSQVLRKCLKYFQKYESSTIKWKYQEEKQRLILDQLGINPLEYSNYKKSLKKKIKNTQLDPEHQAQLNSYNEKTLKPLAKKYNEQTIEKERQVLITYVRNKNNNGKKTFQITANFFKEAPVTAPTKMNSSKVNLLSSTSNFTSV
jgi:hypothetical protein